MLQRVAQPDIDFTLELPDESILMDCDSRQLGQCLTNLLKNSAEAIEGLPESPGTTVKAGKIAVKAGLEDGMIFIEIADDGPGLPKENRDRLTEPYVTTRERGTGLGLAIVSKIMEDHAGEFKLLDRSGSGALATLRFPNRIEGKKLAQIKTDKKLGTRD